MSAARWDAVAGVAACPVIAWQGDTWRGHRPKYAAIDATGSRLHSGRYNRGLDHFQPHEVWAALYLGLGRDICIGEVLRHTTPAQLPRFNYRFTRIRVALSQVLDCRDPTLLGLTPLDLWHDTDWTIPQSLAAMAIARGVEAILVPSATRLGDNLVVFPDYLQPGSQLQPLDHVDPPLYVPR